VVQAAVEAVQLRADAKQLHLSLAGAEDPRPIEGDAARLQQVVVSLLTNAITFTPPNGSIMVSVGRTDGAEELIVHDTGQGMSAEVLSHIFDGFQQDRESRQHHAGLGLGLALARHVVEAHGGTIVVNSDGEGKGSTVTVRVPLALSRGTSPVANATVGMAQEECPPVLAGLCALVVEDQLDSRTLLDEVLTRCGVRVIAVDSAHDALQMLDSHSIDVIVSDIGLEREDGLALMRRVRERPAERGGTVPAMAVSAYGGAADRARALEAGYQTYVSKPLAPAEVTAAVAALVRRG
jgi:CheY-like chemotaxis protein/anti-sigma regulatory factor (Ser/Thr protein kinase)